MPCVVAAPLLILFVGVKVTKRKMGHGPDWEKQIYGIKGKKERKKENEGLTNAVLARVHVFSKPRHRFGRLILKYEVALYSTNPHYMDLPPLIIADVPERRH